MILYIIKVWKYLNIAMEISHMIKQVWFLNSAQKIDTDSLQDQCVTPSIDQFPIWEIFCCSPSCKWMNQWMNQNCYYFLEW